MPGQEVYLPIFDQIGFLLLPTNYNLMASFVATNVSWKSNDDGDPSNYRVS